MAFLRKRDTGAVTDWLPPDSAEYQTLRAMKFQSQVTAAVPSNITGIPSGGVGGAILAGQPVWEDVAEEDVALPDPPGGRVGVLYLGSTATAAAETTSEEWLPEVAGTLTDVEYVVNPAAASGITGQATNNRVLTLQQVTFAGTSTVTRAVTSLAAVTFGSGTNALPGVPTALTISTAAFAAGAPLQLVSSVNGTGLADPGGVVYFVYTRI